MATVEKRTIPVRYLSDAEMSAETEAKLGEYEHRYEMPSETMASLLEMDAIRPTAEVLKWYVAYQGLLSIRKTTPTTGTLGTTTSTSTKPG